MPATLIQLPVSVEALTDLRRYVSGNGICQLHNAFDPARNRRLCLSDAFLVVWLPGSAGIRPSGVRASKGRVPRPISDASLRPIPRIIHLTRKIILRLHLYHLRVLLALPCQKHVPRLKSKSQYKHNGTGDFIAENLDTPESQQFLRQQARKIGAEGRGKKRKLAQAYHDTGKVAKHRATKKKNDAKKAADIKAINKCKPIFAIQRFKDPKSLDDMRKDALELQCKWHRLREPEIDKKTEIPPLSKLKKAELADVIVAALARWLPRIKSGEVPKMGLQLPGGVELEETVLEREEEEDDAGYGERD